MALHQKKNSSSSSQVFLFFPAVFKSSKARESPRGESVLEEREPENTLLAGHTSVINFCSSFVTEYVWAHMLDYKAM